MTIAKEKIFILIFIFLFTLNSHSMVLDKFIYTDTFFDSKNFKLYKTILNSNYLQLDSMLQTIPDTQRKEYINYWGEKGTPLMYACSFTHNAIIRDEDKTDRNIGQLYRAYIVEILLKHGANPNQFVTINSKDIYPLHAAILNMQQEIVVNLVKYGASINQADTDGYTPLHYAVQVDQTGALVYYLMKHGANPLLKTSFKKYSHKMVKFTCYELAIVYEKKEIAKKIIDWPDSNGNNLLHKAVLCNDLALAQQLINYGAQVNMQTLNNDEDHVNELDKTALHLAIEEENLEMISLLLNNNASVNMENIFSNIPLYYAIFSKSLKIIEILVMNGSEVNKKNLNGVTPLSLAFYIINEFDLLQSIALLLLTHGADINAQNNLGYTILAWCLQNERSVIQDEKIKFLLTIPGVDTRIANTIGQTPLQIAYANNNSIHIAWLKQAATNSTVSNSSFN